MTRFNPFARVSGKYGAPMGRHGHDAASYDGASKLYARHCGGDGYYDRGGAYWGHSKVCAVWTRGGGWCAYVEARTPDDAITIVKDLATRREFLTIAAPDMLAALREAEACVQSARDDCHDLGRPIGAALHNKGLKTILAAIAKAEGRA